MKFCAVVLASLCVGATTAWAALPGAADDYRQLTNVRPLPVALDSSFEFRKTKLFTLGDAPGRKKAVINAPGTATQPAIQAETSYRLFGAVTELDKRRRYGQYFDFFWRAKRAVPGTVRLEYRQDGLHELTQAREVSYANAQGSHKTAFAVIGDDFLNDGRIIAWRCTLIVDGRIVAENRSYLWR